jgi:hypothetical protein
MANLDELLYELTTIVENLKLTVGNSQTIEREIIRLERIQAQLSNLQSAIAQKLVTKINNATVGVLSSSTETTVFNSQSSLINPLLTNGERFIADKFGNQPTKLTLNELESQISRWLEWVELLRNMAEDILSNSQLINQLNFNINYPSLPNKLQELEEKLKIDLSSNKANILQQQIEQIRQSQAELLQVQQKSTEVFDHIKNTQNILLILLNLSAFCGNSGLELEWFDDEYGFIISSGDKCQALGDIIYDCELFQEKVILLSLKAQNMLEKSEKALSNLPQSKLGLITKFLARNRIHSTLLITSSLLVLGLGTWTIKDKIISAQKAHNVNQEKIAIANWKSAKSMGMEASILVQKKPLPLTDWQKAESKWQKAVNLLEAIPQGTSVSEQAKKRLDNYRINQIAISKRVDLEKTASSKLEAAEKLAVEAEFIVKNAPDKSALLQQGKDKLQEAINLLQAIPEGTYVSKQVQEKLISYQNKYEAIKAK